MEEARCGMKDPKLKIKVKRTKRYTLYGTSWNDQLKEDVSIICIGGVSFCSETSHKMDKNKENNDFYDEKLFFFNSTCASYSLRILFI